MRFLFLVTLIILCFTANCTTYYISANGSDANNGTTASTSWKTITKLNSFFSALKPGDKVLFNRGDVFYGSIAVNQSGTASSPITIGAYGSGSNPVITGLSTVAAWTNLGGNIWESTGAISTLSVCNMVTVNGVNTAMGRTPNTDNYYTISSYAGGSTTPYTLTSSSLNSSVINWTGAVAIVRKGYPGEEYCNITAQSGSTITINDVISNGNPSSTGFGFFIQNDPRTLDVQNEWYYNPSTKKIRIYSVSAPANVQVTSVNDVISNNGFDYITIDGVTLMGANNDVINCQGSTDGIVIRNCNISFAGNNGIETAGANVQDSIYNNFINDVAKGGLYLGGKSYVGFNTVRNSGILHGQSNWNVRNNGIYCYAQGVTSQNDVLIEHNTVVNSGCDGIAIGSKTYYARVQYNFVDSSCLANTDNGGIYKGGNLTSSILIDHNIVLHSIGYLNGTPNVGIPGYNAVGLYGDEGVTNTVWTNNTSAFNGEDGFKLHSFSGSGYVNSNNNRIENNTFFGNKINQILIQNNHGGLAMYADTLRNNIAFSQLTNQWTLNVNDQNNNIPGLGLFDLNYYVMPLDYTNLITSQISSGGTVRTLPNWQTYSGFDKNSATAPKVISDTTNVIFRYNASMSPLTVTLNGNYIDAKGNSYNGSVVLNPFTSIILIQDGVLPNLPPTANAGPDQTITLPINSVTLNGSGTDSDGTVSSYNWTKISGPSSGTITNADIASTSATALVQGICQFQLTVTDNKGATGKDTIIVTVKPANIPPRANAGADQTITLPTNYVSLNGTGIDTDGTISAYTWVKISGPSSGSITNTAIASSSAVGLVQGIYQFQLTVTDNNGAAGVDTVVVTVNAAPNQSPVANAGLDQTITLPVNIVALSGSGNDPDGTISSYSWAEISGPAGYNIVNLSSPSTSVSGLVQGVYQFQLTVTDNNGATGTDVVVITVNPAPNIPPVANAGADQSVTLPVNTITLSGTSSDTDGTVVSYSWTEISGPSGYAIVNSSSPVTDVTGLVQGIYQFQLQVTDNNGAIGTDIMQVTVNASLNIPPVANAGTDQSITLPVNTVTLSGSGSDADGTVVTYAWTEISGPSAYIIVNSNSASTDVSGFVQGTYQFQLTVTDNNGALGTDIIQVTVNAALNIQPVANAGIDQLITLPVNTVTLSGSGNDSDGNVVSYAWTKISGPSSYTVINQNSASTNVSGLVQGVYQFQLTVTDNNGATGSDVVIVTVNAAIDIPPVANAGADQSVTLPVNTITLSGSGSDADGSVISYAWTEISGPASYNIVNAASPATDVSSLVQGVYQFQLTVTDNNGVSASDIVQVTVNPAVNIPPVASAGIDQSITLPANIVTLSGSGNDADGIIVSYAWTEISGPSSYNIVNSGSPSTEVAGLIQGVYQFQLTVTDNNGAVGVDIIQVTVNPAVNIPPVANAGIDQSITLPANIVTLSGSGNDADGTVVSYAWTAFSGPSGYTIVTPNSASTDFSGLVQGVYEFQLTVTDNNGAIGTDIVQITVNAALNIPPVANAGADQSITLPVTAVTLSGSGSDADGTISSYSWTEISGPSSYTITSSNSSSTDISGLVQGVYQFQLIVTDNNGAIGADIIQVTVNAALNIPPVANAGADQSITLPANTVTLSGSGSDADGTVISYGWIAISGPSSYNIVNSNSPSTDVSGLVQGVYQFQLTVTDNNGAISADIIQVTVNAVLNIPPVANAGIDQSITLPIDSLTFSGSGSDADGEVVSYAWTKISGPASYNIVDATTPASVVRGLVRGVYQFQLQVTDDNGATTTDTMQVIVNASLNIPPVANAGADQSITLPVNTATLTGSGSDEDGTVVSYTWTAIYGPPGYSITNASSPTTTVTGLVQGVYQFQLTVTDNNGSTGTDIVQVTVNIAGNISPVANAGTDLTITLPTNSVTVTGSGSDADGTISSYAWTEISGPSGYNIVNATSAATSINELVQGVYQFQLQVTDNSGATSTDIMQVTVNAAPNIPPVANAGADWTITLPANSLTVTGSGSDADGTISSYSWTKISGPPNYSIVNGTSAVTDVNGLVEGVYEFELKVTDNNGAKGRDTMHITVNAGPNIPPDANAGSDQTITLPENAVAIAGSGSDTDGVVSNYKWSKISGPANYTIVSQTSAATNITALVEGVYQFELEVTDNGGAIGRDTIQITVNAAANKAPVADAGRDQTITLPTDSLSLIGTGTDADGTIVGYSWSQISGPSKAALASPGSDGTLCSGLIGGTYQFELTVTDNFGSIGRDTVTIVVTEPRLNFDQKNSINIYPNPVVDITTVEINTAQPSIKLLLVVTDLKGVLIYKEDIAPGQNTILDKINLGNRAKGIYIVTVYFGDKTWQSKKLIKQ